MRSDKTWFSNKETVESIRQKCLDKNLELIEVFFEISKSNGRNKTMITYICLNCKDRGIQKSHWSSMEGSEGCKYCARKNLAFKKKKDISIVLDAFKNNGLIPLFTPDDYKKNNQKLACLCANHFEAGELSTTFAAVKNNQTPCTLCVRDKYREKLAFTQEEFESRINERYNGEIIILGKYINNATPIKYKHKTCGFEYSTIPSTLLVGSGCVRCLGRLKKNTEYYKQEVFEKFGDEFIVLGEYKTDKDKIKIKHNRPDCDYEWSPVAGSILAGNGCPRCNLSHGERRVEKYLKDNNIKYLIQHKFPDCKNIFCLAFDFAILNEDETLRCLIEYDGELHYNAARWSSNPEKLLNKLQKTQHNDSLKTQYCIDNNIKLIRIPYWDFKNIEIILNKELSITK